MRTADSSIHDTAFYSITNLRPSMTESRWLRCEIEVDAIMRGVCVSETGPRGRDSSYSIVLVFLCSFKRDSMLCMVVRTLGHAWGARKNALYFLDLGPFLKEVQIRVLDIFEMELEYGYRTLVWSFSRGDARRRGALGRRCHDGDGEGRTNERSTLHCTLQALDLT